MIRVDGFSSAELTEVVPVPEGMQPRSYRSRKAKPNRAISPHEIPQSGIAAFVADLARRHGIAYERDGSSALAQVITRLADDDVVPDETENLIIALRRAKVIDGAEMVTLLGRYFDETR